MRYLILSDIHGNRHALDRVLEDAPLDEHDMVLVLGDLVGYGASPNEVVAAIRGLEKPLVVIRGNHDKVAVGIDDGFGFNPVARKAADWTANVLEPDNAEFLAAMPMGPVEAGPGIVICHGSPRDEDEYLFSALSAMQILEELEAGLTLFGHTHLPVVYSWDGEDPRMASLEASALLELEPDRRYLVNPGSVGQPRDSDPRASFMTYDSEARTLEMRRSAYPVGEAQHCIRQAGLPRLLAERLAFGL